MAAMRPIAVMRGAIPRLGAFPRPSPRRLAGIDRARRQSRGPDQAEPAPQLASVSRAPAARRTVCAVGATAVIAFTTTAEPPVAAV